MAASITMNAMREIRLNIRRNPFVERKTAGLPGLRDKTTATAPRFSIMSRSVRVIRSNCIKLLEGRRKSTNNWISSRYRRAACRLQSADFVPPRHRHRQVLSDGICREYRVLLAFDGLSAAPSLQHFGGGRTAAGAVGRL